MFGPVQNEPADHDVVARLDKSTRRDVGGVSGRGSIGGVNFHQTFSGRCRPRRARSWCRRLARASREMADSEALFGARPSLTISSLSGRSSSRRWSANKRAGDCRAVRVLVRQEIRAHGRRRPDSAQDDLFVVASGYDETADENIVARPTLSGSRDLRIVGTAGMDTIL